MNNFCRNLGDSLPDEFEIEVDILVSKKKKKETCAHVLIKTANIINFSRRYFILSGLIGKETESLSWIFFFVPEAESEP